jgi:hypothetical protein
MMKMNTASVTRASRQHTWQLERGDIAVVAKRADLGSPIVTAARRTSIDLHAAVRRQMDE